MRNTHCLSMAFFSLSPSALVSSLGTRPGKSFSVIYSIAPFFISLSIQLKLHLLNMFAVRSGLSAWPFAKCPGVSSSENSGPRHSKANATSPSSAMEERITTTGSRDVGDDARTVRAHIVVVTAYAGQKSKRTAEEVRDR